MRADVNIKVFVQEYDVLLFAKLKTAPSRKANISTQKRLSVNVPFVLLSVTM